MTKPKEDSIILGKFILVKFLGKGSFAKVYLARNLRTNESVAIKVLSKKKLQESKSADDQLKTEISIMRRLHHPNIVQLYEVMASKTKIYLVMEYVNGGTVFDKISSAGRETRVAKEEENTWRRYFQQLIISLDFCHISGIYHRDLKSDNLLLDDKGNLKLADFGLSASEEQLGNYNMFHTLCGAPSYLAPEVLSRVGYEGAAADIWSCGVILYELFVGDLPFGDSRDGNGALIKRMCMREYSCPTDLPREVRDLISRLLDPNHLTRITILEIMEVPWFKVGFSTNNLSFHHQDSCNNNMSISGHEVVDLPNSPCMNAFSLLASWPAELDLAPLLGDSKGGLRFMSKQPVSAIISKFEEIARANGFSCRTKEWTVSMEGINLSVIAEIFEVAPSLYAVDVRKTGGDKAEYKNFLEQHMKPTLRDIGWGTWKDNYRRILREEQEIVTLEDKRNEIMVQPILHALIGVLGTFIGVVGTFIFMSVRAGTNNNPNIG